MSEERRLLLLWVLREAHRQGRLRCGEESASGALSLQQFEQLLAREKIDLASVDARVLVRQLEEGKQCLSEAELEGGRDTH